MAHCYSVDVELDGIEQEICASHVPGNEELRKSVESWQSKGAQGKHRKATKEEVDRAVDYFRETGLNRKNFLHELREEP